MILNAAMGPAGTITFPEVAAWARRLSVTYCERHVRPMKRK